MSSIEPNSNRPSTQAAQEASTLREALSSELSGLSPGRLRTLQAFNARLDAKAELFTMARSNTHHANGLPALTSADRLKYFQSDTFRRWIQIECKLGNQVVWITDLDKAKASGDSFVYFTDWRARNAAFTTEQVEAFAELLRANAPSLHSRLPHLLAQSPSKIAHQALKSWARNELKGSEGISLKELFMQGYWSSFKGMTRPEKMKLVQDFAPEYQNKIFPGAREEHLALAAAGVKVIIVTNGDADLARSIAPLMGISPDNVAGVDAYYDGEGRATGEAHILEIEDEEWARRPQPGKPIRFECFLRERFPNRQVILAGFDGDSPAADGGGMLFLKPKLGYFMVDTPGSHDRMRITKFNDFVRRYGQRFESHFVVLGYNEPIDGPIPSHLTP